MGILAWLIVGLIAGFIGSKIVNHSGEGLVRDILLGIVGAIIGGAIFQQLGYAGVTGVNLPSILIAAIGAVLVLVVFHAIRGQRTTA
ncbi:MAG: GlsB/YeaQ/YmgE family stress response membrane protein [Candidatus Binataceae bacterium]